MNRRLKHLGVGDGAGVGVRSVVPHHGAGWGCAGLGADVVLAPLGLAELETVGQLQERALFRHREVTDEMRRPVSDGMLYAPN